VISTKKLTDNYLVLRRELYAPTHCRDIPSRSHPFANREVQMNTRQNDIEILKSNYQPWINGGTKTLGELKKRIQDVRSVASKSPDFIEFVDYRHGGYILNDLDEDAKLIDSILSECGDITF
jgi:hypothetical protein